VVKCFFPLETKKKLFLLKFSNPGGPSLPTPMADRLNYSSPVRREHWNSETVTVGFATVGCYIIIRATKSQIFSAFFKANETSTNQISRSYHEQLPSYKVKRSQNLS